MTIYAVTNIIDAMPMTPHDFLVSLGTGEVAHASAESSFLGHRPGPARGARWSGHLS